jgi:hypothetical protein
MEETNKLPEEQVIESTSVEQKEVDIDALFGAPGAESVMLPDSGDSEKEKKSIFSTSETDLSFIDGSSEDSEVADARKAVEEITAIVDDAD